MWTNTVKLRTAVGPQYLPIEVHFISVTASCEVWFDIFWQGWVIVYSFWKFWISTGSNVRPLEALSQRREMQGHPCTCESNQSEAQASSLFLNCGSANNLLIGKKQNILSWRCLPRNPYKRLFSHSVMGRLLKGGIVWTHKYWHVFLSPVAMWEPPFGKFIYRVLQTMRHLGLNQHTCKLSEAVRSKLLRTWEWLLVSYHIIWQHLREYRRRYSLMVA